MPAKFSLQSVYDIYSQFLGYFPPKLHGIVSIVLAVLIVVGIYKVLRKQLAYLILLIVLLPASGPILKEVWEQILQLLQFLVSKR